MIKAERGLQGFLLAAGLTLAIVGSASCQRQPEDQRPLPTSTSASGVPKPSPTETPRAISPSKVKPKPRKVVTVDATNKNGAPTGITLRRGEPLNFEASGTWCMGIGECGGPDGIRPAGRGEEDIVVKGEKIGTLAARIGDSIVSIGSNAGMTSEEDKGEEIVLFMNDRPCCYHDNSGSVTVSIFDSKKMLSWIEETTIKPAQQAARPAEAQKSSGSAGGERVTIRLKPEELFRALLTTPFQPNELPPGFTAKSKSAGTLDATAQALKAIGQVNALVAENDPRFGGVPNVAISYTVFPDVTNAKGAYDVLAMSSNNKALADLGYPATVLIQSSFMVNVTICAVLVENTLIASMITSPAGTSQEAKAIMLAQIGLGHLRKVGR